MASFLGIDLSKENFHACLLSHHVQAKRQFPNMASGIPASDRVA